MSHLANWWRAVLYRTWQSRGVVYKRIYAVEPHDVVLVNGNRSYSFGAVLFLFRNGGPASPVPVFLILFVTGHSTICI